MADNLPELLGDLREQDVLAAVASMKESGVPALTILAGLQRGMEIVGRRFESKEYFLSELIMSAEIFNSAVGMVESLLGQGDTRTWATMVLGTVYEDIHDVGKNIVATVLKCNGINVIDLGINVPPEKFVEEVRRHRPDFVGLSCLLTTAFDNMKLTVEALETAGLREGRTVMIGGGPVNQMVCDYVGADVFCKSVQESLDKARELKGGKRDVV